MKNKPPPHNADHWRKIWQKAKNNMPSRLTITKKEIWLVAERPVPIGEFIKAQAKGMMKIMDDLVYELHTIEEPHFYGHHMALTRVMDYRLTKNSRTPGALANEWVRSSIDRGCKPRDSDKARLLCILAGPNGRQVAIQKLAELGVIHRYQLTQEEKDELTKQGRLHKRQGKSRGVLPRGQ